MTPIQEHDREGLIIAQSKEIDALRAEVERLREWQDDARRIIERIASMTTCLCNDVSGSCVHCESEELIQRALLGEEG